MFKNNVFNVSVNTKKWLKAAGIRALKTMAQVVAGGLITGAMLSEINWVALFSTAAVAGIASIATSIAGLPEVTEEPEVTEGE